MPPVRGVLTTTTSNVAVDTVRTLHSELAAIGLPVTGAEAAGTPTFGTTTEARVRNFQQLYKLPETGDVDEVTGATMTLASLAAEHTDPAELRTALQGAVNAVTGSQVYNDRLARLAIMVGDYSLAARMSPRLRDLSGIEVDLGDGMLSDGWGPSPPRQPEVPFPENFYSYRNPLISAQDISALRAAANNDEMPRLARVSSTHLETSEEQPWDLVWGVPGVSNPPATPEPGMTPSQRLTASALAFLNAIEAWQHGNAKYERRRFASAIEAHDRCQQAALEYFAYHPEYDFHYTTTKLADRVDELVWHIADNRQTWSDVWAQLGWRRQLLSLAELGQFDWTPITGGRYPHIAYQLLKLNVAGQQPPPGQPIDPRVRKIFLDTRLLVIAAVLVPLARGEANRMRRQYADAVADFARVRRTTVPVPGSTPPATVPAVLACDFIEVPFARLLQIETMLDQGEAQYKARTRVDDEQDPTRKADGLARIGAIAQDLAARGIPGDPRPDAKPLQHLWAALTYADAIAEMNGVGDYLAHAWKGVQDQQAAVTSSAANGDAAAVLDTTTTVPTVNADAATATGSSTYPHASYLEFSAPTLRERNPRVYALLLQAQSRLLQIWSGFNYLGYREDHTPPWRFAFLLDRARYFAEHAKNAQRDYLNFLNNAENEELKELNAAQAVELEKANAAVEFARANQAAKEVTASQESLELANLNKSNAETRLQNYKEFNESAGWFGDLNIAVGVVTSMVTQNPGPMLGAIVDAGAQGAQRDLDRKNLELSVEEAKQAANVASAQHEVAKAGLVVAQLQRQAAIFRHEHALQTLQFIRNQTLNTEQWYRLAAAIRSVADTYLRYAIESAFLAQQAYNFEVDKRLDVIRFDYDLSDVGAMLAADFLLRDLDGLEKDLIVSQTTRQQQVRYVVSMAREFPDALRTLADTDTTKFTIRLEQLERRFPGLANLRITAVDVQPLCLMDATRFNVRLTHLATGMARLEAQPGTSPLNTTDLPTGSDWLTGPAASWPVKIHASAPETAVYSGLSRQETTSLSTIAANQRGAFEGLPAASAWRIDMSMTTNHVVPDSLADVVLTFTLSGYYHEELRHAVDTAGRPMARTTTISARQTFPDAFYEFNQSGQLQWPLTRELLSLREAAGALRNVAIIAAPAQKRPELGRILCSYPVEFDIDATGKVKPLRALPLLTFTSTGLTVTITTSLAGISVDFGDGSDLMTGPQPSHTYAAPGRYDVLVRIIADQRLTEYRAAVVVSRQHVVSPPCIVVPDLKSAVSGGQLSLTPALASSGEQLPVRWRIDGQQPIEDSDPVSFNLDPGRYVLRFTATRPLNACFYSRQRYDTTTLPLDGLQLVTNRTFDTQGNETTAPTALNPFGHHVFGGRVLSPTDVWTFELPIADNPALTTVSAADNPRPDLSELADAVLIMEYTGGQP